MEDKSPRSKFHAIRQAQKHVDVVLFKKVSGIFGSVFERPESQASQMDEEVSDCWIECLIS